MPSLLAVLYMYTSHKYSFLKVVFGKYAGVYREKQHHGQNQFVLSRYFEELSLQVEKRLL